MRRKMIEEYRINKKGAECFRTRDREEAAKRLADLQAKKTKRRLHFAVERLLSRQARVHGNRSFREALLVNMEVTNGRKKHCFRHGCSLRDLAHRYYTVADSGKKKGRQLVQGMPSAYRPLRQGDRTFQKRDTGQQQKIHH